MAVAAVTSVLAVAAGAPGVVSWPPATARQDGQPGQQPLQARPAAASATAAPAAPGCSPQHPCSWDSPGQAVLPGGSSLDDPTLISSRYVSLSALWCCAVGCVVHR